MAAHSTTLRCPCSDHPVLARVEVKNGQELVVDGPRGSLLAYPVSEYWSGVRYYRLWSEIGFGFPLANLDGALYRCKQCRQVVWFSAEQVTGAPRKRWVIGTAVSAENGDRRVSEWRMGGRSARVR